MTLPDTDRFRTMLLEERERVVAAIDHLHRENPGSLEDETGELVSGSADNHMGDTATATFDRELDYTLEGNAEAVLTAIDGALRRIEDGTYGTCRVCGREIAPERLEARPWADLCIDDARAQERLD
ncbi:MAG: TraR/DksA C4-type zinc finger protein [Thermoleophilia bacterium]|nr:TraR/DksA C4-type zinc finger protein [Thermoleophilia bacterium]